MEVNSVVAYPVGEGEDIGGKARFAFPLEPVYRLCLRVLAMGSGSHRWFLSAFINTVHQIDSRLCTEGEEVLSNLPEKMRELDSVFLIDESGKWVVIHILLGLVSPFDNLVR